MKYLILVLVILFFSCSEENKKLIVEDNLQVNIEQKLTPKIDKVIISKIDTIINNQNVFSYWLLDSATTNCFIDKIYSDQMNGYMSSSENRIECFLYKENLVAHKLYLNKSLELYEVGEGHKSINIISSSFVDSVYNNALKLKKINYIFNNIDSAKKTIEYLDSKSIAYQNSNLTNEKWLKFDGDFVFGYYDLSINRNDDSVFSLINNVIPTDKIEFTLPQVLTNYDTSKITYRAYSNNEEYINFKKEFTSFEFISEFVKFKPTITIFCTKEEEGNILSLINDKSPMNTSKFNVD